MSGNKLTANEALSLSLCFSNRVIPTNVFIVLIIEKRKGKLCLGRDAYPRIKEKKNP